MRLSQRVSRVQRIFGLIGNAITGKEYNYTSGSIKQAIVLLAIPMILEMVMESLFAVVDIYFVSELGKNSIATVGLTESMLMIIYSLAMGIGMAATALVARRTGEKDKDGASRAAAQTLLVGIIVSLLISIPGTFFAPQLLKLMGAGNEVLQVGTSYTRIMLGSNIVITLLFLVNGIFRGAGNAAMAMQSLWLANIINIICCPIFIFGWGPIPAFGLKGAAIATVVGRSTGVIFQLWFLFRGNKNINFNFALFKPNMALMKQVVKIASSAAGQFLINSASWIVLIRIISSFGEAAIAGYTIGIRVVIFSLLPAWGLANAAATLVGQNLGAQQPDRAEQSVYRAAFYNMAVLGTISVFFIVFTKGIIGMFTHEPEVIRYGVDCLRIVSIGFLVYAFGMVIIQSINGAGDTRTPLLINIVGFWLIQIPLAYILAIIFRFGPPGVFIAICIAETVVAAIGFAIFRRGKWKLVHI